MTHKNFNTILLYLLTYFCAFLALFPFLWSALLATQDSSSIIQASFLPGSHFFDNIRELMQTTNIFSALFNTAIVTFFAVLLAVFLCASAGYVFAVFDFPFKETIFSFLLFTMMVPTVVNLIPYVLIIDFLHISNMLVSVWLPLSISVFGIFLTRQFVGANIPKELLDSARIDGANEIAIFFRIGLPLMTNVLLTIAIIVAVAAWNNFLFPLVALQDPNKQVVTTALRSLIGIGEIPWNVLMTGSFLAMLPMLIAFIFFNKKMIASLTSGAIKS